MNPWLNYHHLYYFKTIAEEGGVSSAAKKLRLGQPTISAQLKQFEEQLDYPLFERNGKKLILTDQGKIALDYAKQIFKLGDEMLQVLNDRITPNRQHLQIGALDSVAKQVTLLLSKAAYQQSPCQVSIIEGSSDQMLRELMSHRVDLMVSNFIPTNENAKALRHRKIASQTVSVYGSKKFLKLKSKFPASLNGQPFILPTFDSKLRYDIDHWLTTQTIRFDVIAESQDIALKKMMAIEGLGLIPATDYSVNLQLKAGQLYKIGEIKTITESLYLLTAERKIANPIANHLFQKFSI